MRTIMISTLVVIISCVLASCGSDSGPPVESGVTYITGQFIDSPVRGLGYSTGSKSETTDAGGNFQCASGETVIFTLDTVTLGSATCGGKITPYELMSESPLSAIKSKRIVKLLMSIDTDGDASNGIDVTGLNVIGGGTLDFSDDTDYQNILTDLGEADVGDAAAATHMQAYMDKTHTVFDGTYTGTMTVTSGSCGAYDLTIKIENAYLSIIKLDASGSSYTTIFNYDASYRRLTGTDGDTILQDIDWGTTDDSYCDDKSGVNKEIVRLNSLKVKHDGSDYYIDGIVTDKTICNNAAWTDHCAFTVILNK